MAVGPYIEQAASFIIRIAYDSEGPVVVRILGLLLARVFVHMQ